MIHVYTRLDTGSRNSYKEIKMDAHLDRDAEENIIGIVLFLLLLEEIALVTSWGYVITVRSMVHGAAILV